MNREIRPPPKIIPGGIPPPRKDYLDMRQDTEKFKKDIFDPIPQPIPTSRHPPVEESFEADVQNEIMKLELELRRQLAEEETKLNHYSSDVNMPPSDKNMHSNFDKYNKISEPPNPLFGDPRNSPRSPRSQTNFPVSTSDQPYDSQYNSKHNGYYDSYTDPIPINTHQNQRQQQPKMINQSNENNYVSSNNNTMGSLNNNPSFEMKLLGPSHYHSPNNTSSTSRAKGSAISNLYEPDPGKAKQSKVMRQNDYNKQLYDQVSFFLIIFLFSYFT